MLTSSAWCAATPFLSTVTPVSRMLASRELLKPDSLITTGRAIRRSSLSPRLCNSIGCSPHVARAHEQPVCLDQGAIRASQSAGMVLLCWRRLRSPGYQIRSSAAMVFRTWVITKSRLRLAAERL